MVPTYTALLSESRCPLLFKWYLLDTRSGQWIYRSSDTRPIRVSVYTSYESPKVVYTIKFTIEDT